MEHEGMDRISPEKAIKLLKEDGIEVDVEQAKLILHFLYEMAEIAVDLYLNDAKKM